MKAILLWLQDVVDDTDLLPAISIESLDSKAPAASLQMLGSPRYDKRYVNGGGTARQSVAILYRTSGSDTAARVNAPDEMISLMEALETHEADEDTPASVRGIEGTLTPSLVERTAGGSGTGSEVWRAQIVLKLAV